MKVPKDIHDLRKRFRDAQSGCASDTIFMAHAMMFMCERLAKKDRKRPPTEWQRFMGEKMRAGKSLQEAAALWREKKEAKIHIA